MSTDDDATTPAEPPAAPPAAPGLDAIAEDPHGALAMARQAGRVLDTGLLQLVVHHDDVRAALSDSTRYREAFTDALAFGGVTGGTFHQWMATSPLDRDGDEHRSWRALMSRTFTPRQVEGLRPMLAARCHELIDALPTGEPVDLVPTFAEQLPMDALCELIGVPDGDRDDFRSWASTIGLGFDVLGLAARIDEVDDALEQLLAYTTRLVDARAEAPLDDLVSRIARAAADGELSRTEAASSVAGLVFAGHETTRNQLGTTFVLLATTPGAWDDVASGAVEPAAAVEECLRLHGAAVSVQRKLAEPVEIGGVELPADAFVLLSLWSSNRDEDVYPEPDRYDPAANAALGHLAFGHGAHHCLGAALARAELTEAVRAWTARLEVPELLDGVTWRPPFGLTGPSAIPALVRPRPAAASTP